MAKTLTGTVVSDKTDKTIVISILTRKTHPLYKKQYSVTTKFMAHDENNEAKIGDKVIIKETRPLSARKRFTLEKITEKAVISADKTVDSIIKEEEQGAVSRRASKKKSSDADNEEEAKA